MIEEEMTPRERWLATLKRQKPNRVAMDYWATPEVTERLMLELKCKTLKEMYEKLHVDAVISVWPKYVGPKISEGSNIYGCRFKEVKHKTGTYSEIIYSPLAEYQTVSAIKKHYTWPTVDMYDYSEIPDQINGFEDYPVRGGGSEPFLTYKELRGMKQAFLDLYLHPDIVHYCLDQLFEFCYENTKLIYKQIPRKIMFSYVAEDFGGQTGLLFKPEHIREFFLPGMTRLIDIANNNNV
ncbi:MAG: hypothetical protein QXR63_03545 [Candidatus Bathyarchaeia archaeon]